MPSAWDALGGVVSLANHGGSPLSVLPNSDVLRDGVEEICGFFGGMHHPRRLAVDGAQS